MKPTATLCDKSLKVGQHDLLGQIISYYSNFLHININAGSLNLHILKEFGSDLTKHDRAAD